MKLTKTFVCAATLLLGGIPDAHAQTEIETEVPNPAHPPQFTLVEGHRYVHRNWHQFWRFPWQPANWTAPLDYYRGTTYLRFEIHELRAPAMLQFCYFQDRHVSEKHACGPQWTFDAPGVYYRRVVNRELWQQHVVDWTRELLDFMLIDNTSEGAARADVTVDIVVAAAGERLEVADHWQCPAAWSCLGGAPPEDEPPGDDDPEEPPPEEPDPLDDDPDEDPGGPADPPEEELPPDGEGEVDPVEGEPDGDADADRDPAPPAPPPGGSPGPEDFPAEPAERDVDGAPPQASPPDAANGAACAWTQLAPRGAGGVAWAAPLAALLWLRRRRR